MNMHKWTQITDQEGEPLPGVNIAVQGTATGTSTDSEGKYELKVPSLQDTLVVSFVGYQSQEVPVDGQTVVDIQMVPEAIAGEEVVVVGYGTQEEGKVTSSVAAVDDSESNSGEISDSTGLKLYFIPK